MKITCLSLLCLVFIQNVNSQITENQSFYKTSLKLSYYGDNFGVKPGFSIGYEVPFKVIEKERTANSGKVKKSAQTFFYSYNASFYKHKGYNNASYMYPEIGYRYTTNSGFLYELRVGFGLFITINDGPTYTVNSAGEIHKIKHAGGIYGAFHISPGIGWDLSVQNANTPFLVALRPNILFQFPYNGQFLKHFNTEVGFNYSN